MKLDLPEPVAPATSRCGIFARLATTNPPSTSLPRPTTSGWWSERAVPDRSTSPSDTISLSRLGISMPMADLPGIGDRIRTSADATAYAMFFDSAVTFSTFTAGPTSTSYLVTVGPRVYPVTWASMPNSSITWVSRSTTASLALDRALCGEPARSTSLAGSV